MVSTLAIGYVLGCEFVITMQSSFWVRLLDDLEAHVRYTQGFNGVDVWVH